MIIDAHTHISLNLYVASDQSVDRMIGEMDRAGVDLAVVAGVGLPHALRDNNRAVQEAVRRYPQRLIGFLGVNPHERVVSLADIDAAANEWGFRGIKVHPWLSLVPANDPLMYPIMEMAGRYKLPVLFHSGTPPYSTPLLIADIARRYPEVPVIMGHMGKSLLHYDAIPAALLAPNVILETSGFHLVPLMQAAVVTLGATRMVFGSDWVSAGMMHGLAEIDDLEISEEEKRLIKGENMARLLRLAGDGR